MGNDVLKIGLKISNIPIKIVFPHVTDSSSVYVWASGYSFTSKITYDSYPSVPPIYHKFCQYIRGT